jgi:glucose-1-phosphate cytidylyltransferase
MKVVILCGGKGTRLREETEFRPKPMLPIGNRPILWHIMKIYAHYGFKEFILCLGYKGDIIKDYFRNYMWNTCDMTIQLGHNPGTVFHNGHGEEDWSVTLAETGEESMTAYRLRMVQKYLGDDEEFLFTYGDGVGAMNIPESIAHHRACGKAVTLTAVHPPGRFGELGLNGDTTVHGFNEKPQVEGGYINGGYMVCNRKMFDYLPDDPSMMLEQDPMRNLSADNELNAYPHNGFWQPMDTYQEFLMLNRMWDSGTAPWKIWDDARKKAVAQRQLLETAAT